MKRRNFLISAGCACCGLILPSCQTAPITGRKQVSFYPESFLNKQAENAYKRLVARSEISKDKVMTKEINDITKNIIRSIKIYYEKINQPNPTQGFNWEVTLIENETINAFCFPGGKIGVFTGILPYTKTTGGMAALMGHEIAHAVAKHSVEGMSRTIVVETGVSVADIFLGGVIGKTRDTIGQTTGMDVIQMGLVRPHGRQQETEADYLGLIFASMAGYNIYESVDLWKRMNEKSKGREIPKFLSTHPSSAQRIINLRGWIPDVKKQYPKINDL